MSSSTSLGGDSQAPVPPKTAAPPPPRRKLSRRRLWLFRLTAMIVVPVVVFGVLELALRVAGYGYATDFFVDGTALEGMPAWIDNPDFGRRFFPRSLQQVPQPQPFVLPRIKAGGTCRIFVLGESAAMGFPDPSTSFARVLETMLRARYPGTRFEVVNTAMTAINSHVALITARQCCDHQPDLLIVHLGNNEVVGPFGAAGVLGPYSPRMGMLRANLAIKTTRSGQLLYHAMQKVGQGAQSDRNWDGMAMFANSHLSAENPRLTAIYAHFRDNLEDVCRAGAGAGIPVVLCTIPVNLKDSPPFGSQHARDLGSERTAAWDAYYQAGIRKQAEGKLKEAIEQYDQARQLDDQYAELAYRLGKCWAALGNDQEARLSFLRARDRDTLRFRSDTTINNTIREVAAAREAAGVRLADAERAFAQNSPGQVPGEELFLEHVHMTFKGNYLLARTVFEALTNPAPSSLGSPAADSGAPLSETQCAERLAYTDWSDYKFGSQIYERLMQGPPFTFQYDHEERCRRWEKQLAALKARLKAGSEEQAVATYQKALSLNGDDWRMRLNFGELLTERGKLEEAIEQYEEALAHCKHSCNTHCLLGRLELKLQNSLEAERAFRAAQKLEPENVAANVGLAEALEAQGRTDPARGLFEEQVRRNPTNVLALDALGRFLYRGGKLEEARAKFVEALMYDPAAANLHVDLGMALLDLGNVDEAIAQFEEALRLQPDWPQIQDFLAEVRKKRK